MAHPFVDAAMLCRMRAARSPYFFADGHGAPHGAQAPAKSSGDTARPLEGLVKWLPTIATKAIRTAAR